MPWFDANTVAHIDALIDTTRANIAALDEVIRQIRDLSGGCDHPLQQPLTATRDMLDEVSTSLEDGIERLVQQPLNTPQSFTDGQSVNQPSSCLFGRRRFGTPTSSSRDEEQGFQRQFRSSTAHPEQYRSGCPPQMRGMICGKTAIEAKTSRFKK